MLFVADFLKEKLLKKHYKEPFEVLRRLLYIVSRKPLTDPVFAEYVFTHAIFEKHMSIYSVGGLFYEDNAPVLHVFLKYNKIKRSGLYIHHFSNKNYKVIDTLIENHVPPYLEDITYAAFKDQWNYSLKLLPLTEHYCPEFEAVLQERRLFKLKEYFSHHYPTSLSYFTNWEYLELCKQSHP